jgi:hypothetical protein
MGNFFEIPCEITKNICKVIFKPFFIILVNLNNPDLDWPLMGFVPYHQQPIKYIKTTALTFQCDECRI